MKTPTKIYLCKSKSIMIDLPESKLVKHQVKKVSVTVKGSKIYSELNGKRLYATIRYDDECGNGHNSFSITGSCGGNNGVAGCIHDFISEQMPELKPLIKYHLFDSKGPMHYVSNSLYHASNRDCWGKLKGEVKGYKTQLKFSDFPILFSVDSKLIKFLESNPSEEVLKSLELVECHHVNRKGDDYKFSSKFNLKVLDSDDWYKAIFSNETEAQSYVKAFEKYGNDYELVRTPNSWGEGKESDLKGARSSAVWPDASLADFTEEKLLERLPSLVDEFKNDVESLDFTF